MKSTEAIKSKQNDSAERVAGSAAQIRETLRSVESEATCVAPKKCVKKAKAKKKAKKGGKGKKKK